METTIAELLEHLDDLILFARHAQYPNFAELLQSAHDRAAPESSTFRERSNDPSDPPIERRGAAELTPAAPAPRQTVYPAPSDLDSFLRHAPGAPPRDEHEP